MSSSYDGSLAMSRKLTEDESKDLRVTLLPYFHASSSRNLAPEDISDLVEYGATMITNMKSVDYAIQELLGMDLDFFTPEVADKIGAAMADFIQKLSGGDEASGEGEEDADKNAASAEVRFPVRDHGYFAFHPNLTRTFLADFGQER